VANSKSTAVVTENIDFKLHATDTGSTPVQIHLLTGRISHLTKHFQSNPKDKHSRHGLLKIIRKRQKLLQYFKKTQREAYYKLIKELQIRDKD
jgi:small subunit ribosomal protein S15